MSEKVLYGLLMSLLAVTGSIALLAAGLAVIGWIELLAGIVLALVQNNIVSRGVAMGIAALFSFAGTGGLALIMMRRSGMPLFAATRRQFAPRRNLETKVQDGSPPLLPYEQEVQEGWMAHYASYKVVRKWLRRHLGSLLSDGGMLTSITVRHLVRDRRKPKDHFDSGRPSAWTKVISSAYRLTPLWCALNVASGPQRSNAPTSVLQPDGSDAMLGKRHES